MKNSDSVGALGLGVLNVILVVSSAIFFTPGPLTRAAGRDAWLTTLLAGVLGVAGAYILGTRYFALRQAPSQRAAPWPALRVAVSLIFAGYAALLGSLVIAETAHVFQLVMPETPIVVFVVMLGLAAWWVAAYGGETVARVGVILFPVMVVTAFTNLGLTLPAGADFGQLTPFLSNGLGPVLRPLPVAMAWIGEMSLLTYYAGDVRQPRMAARYLVASVVVIALMMAVVTVTAVVVMGPAEVARSFAPVITLARVVRVNPLLSRVETALLTAWLLGIYVKVAVIAFAGARALEGGLGISRRRRTLLTGAFAAVSAAVAALGFPSNLVLTAYLETVWPPLGSAMFLFTLMLSLLPPARNTGRRPGA